MLKTFLLQIVGVYKVHLNCVSNWHVMRKKVLFLDVCWCTKHAAAQNACSFSQCSHLLPNSSDKLLTELYTLKY